MGDTVLVAELVEGETVVDLSVASVAASVGESVVSSDVVARVRVVATVGVVTVVGVTVVVVTATSHLRPRSDVK